MTWGVGRLTGAHRRRWLRCRLCRGRLLGVSLLLSEECHARSWRVVYQRIDPAVRGGGQLRGFADRDVWAEGWESTFLELCSATSV